LPGHPVDFDPPNRYAEIICFPSCANTPQRVLLQKCLGKVMPLSQAAEAHRLLENRLTTGKVVHQAVG